MDHETADNRIADAIWWLKGFSAATRAEDRSEIESMARSLSSIRQWLSRLPLGLERTVGTYDNAMGVVLTEHEFETVWDALNRNATREDCEVARNKLKLVLDKFSEERRAMRKAKEDLPF